MSPKYTSEHADSLDELVAIAYRKLKQDVYFDHMDLFLRARLAWFEGTGDLEKKLQMIANGLVHEVRGGTEMNSWVLHGLFQEEKGLRCRIFPKRVEVPDSDGPEIRGRFVSNTRESARYRLTKVDYLIDAPIYVYVISVLWCMIVGRKLDLHLDSGCLGNRLDLDKSPRYDKSSKLFKLFYQQYNQWRDEGMRAAKSILDRGESVAVVSLDVKECYYHLSIPWDDLYKHQAVVDDPLATTLTRLLQTIHQEHRRNVRGYCTLTHSHDVMEAEGLPIGLPSSRVLANWIFSDLDKQIRERVRPEYYGRYVDDMLIVIQDPLGSGNKESVETILKTHFIDTGLISPVRPDNSSDYRLRTPLNAKVTEEKLAVYYFDRNHSRAGLNNILDKIQKTASEFRFLPHDDEGRELDQCAFDILYDGSINKLSSITGVSENSTELSKYLARRLVENRLTSSALDKSVMQQLGRFWRGRNIFDFCRLWEKTFSLLLVKDQHSELEAYLSRIKATIKRLCWMGHSDNSDVFLAEFNDKLRADLFEYLHISIAMPLSLIGVESRLASKKLDFALNDDQQREFNVRSTAHHLRTSNLMRHQLIAWPLLNYTQYTGPLIHFNPSLLAPDGGLELDEHKKRWSPRFLHFDEMSVFRVLQQMVHPEDGSDFSMGKMLADYREINPDIPVRITREEYPRPERKGTT